ncbi:hypothetical protein [Flavobacterium sp.]|uniref:hypothetical protein n=1 Tax=Flavobacterium sp. TaxID=239 RepID=UPI003D0F4097
MKYKKSNTLVCIADSKNACLYFDEIIPLNLGELIPWENNGDIEAHEILKKVLPPSLLDSSNIQGIGSLFNKYIETYANVFPASIGIDISKNKEYFDNRTHALFPLLIKEKEKLLNSLSQPINKIFGEDDFSNGSIQNEDPAFVLNGLSLIDTSQISWKHIIELREDKEALQKLRRLRTFIFENYENKSLNFINDDLLNRIENYENTTKKWGLKTKDSVFKIIFNEKTAIAGTAATIMSAFSGVPISASLGSVCLIGNIILEIRSHKRDLHQFKQDNPITYLIDIKKIAE